MIKFFRIPTHGEGVSGLASLVHIVLYTPHHLMLWHKNQSQRGWVMF